MSRPRFFVSPIWSNGMQKKVTRRTRRLLVRLRPHERELIDQAASVRVENLSEYVRAVLLSESRRVLAQSYGQAA